jgi:hypothetical protein
LYIRALTPFYTVSIEYCCQYIYCLYGDASTAWVRARFVNTKGCTRLATTSDQVYQLLAQLLRIFYYAQNKENIKYLPMVTIFKLFVLRAKTKYEYNCVNAIKRKTTLISLA